MFARHASQQYNHSSYSYRLQPVMCEQSQWSAVEVWESEMHGDCQGAFGERDVLIIRSSESLEGPDIVSRKKGTWRGSELS